MGRRGFTLNSDFYCTSCGKQGFGIPRIKNNAREVGHLKKLWCIYCKREVNFAETKEFTKYDKDMFRLEYENGNFDETGIRILDFGKFKEKMNNEGKLDNYDSWAWSR